MFHNLCFEGEYLNGIKNGKGKEYNSRTFEVFEGEYLKEKKMVMVKYLTQIKNWNLKENI